MVTFCAMVTILCHADILHNGDQISFKPHPQPMAFPAHLTHIRQFGDLGTDFIPLLRPCLVPAELAGGCWACFPSQFCSAPSAVMDALVNTEINPRGQSYRVKPPESLWDATSVVTAPKNTLWLLAGAGRRGIGVSVTPKASTDRHPKALERCLSAAAEEELWGLSVTHRSQQDTCKPPWNPPRKQTAPPQLFRLSCRFFED